MAKRRIGTIQSFRPGYGALMPEKRSYGKACAHFKVCVLKEFGKLAGAAGLEPATCGFGDRRSTN